MSYLRLNLNQDWIEGSSGTAWAYVWDGWSASGTAITTGASGVVNKNKIVKINDSTYDWEYDLNLVATKLEFRFPAQENLIFLPDGSGGWTLDSHTGPLTENSIIFIPTIPYTYSSVNPITYKMESSDGSYSTGSLHTYSTPPNRIVDLGDGQWEWGYYEAAYESIVFTFPSGEKFYVERDSNNLYTIVNHSLPEEPPIPTSTAYLNEDGNGIIVIHNPAGWSTADWTAELFLDDTYTRYDLYAGRVNGTGVLTDDNTTLNIVITDPPKEIQLKVGESFNKRYTFYDGAFAFPQSLVFKNSVLVNYNETPAFIIFNRSTDKLNLSSYFKARFVKTSFVIEDGEKVDKSYVKGFALGVPFEYAVGQRDGYSAYFGMGGVIFTKVWMLEPVEVGEELDFLVQLNGGVYSHKVVWNGIAPACFDEISNPHFDVQPDDNFMTW